MSLINDYLQILEGTVGNLKAGQDLIAGQKINKLEIEADIDKPKETGPSQKEGEGKPKALKAKEGKLQENSSNPFDALYNKILAQENWEEADDAANMPGAPAGDLEMSFSGDVTDEVGGEEGGEEETDPMMEVLNSLKAAVSALERALGSEEGGEEESGEEEEEEESGEEGSEEKQGFGESSEEEDEDEEGEEEEMKEEVEAQELGHALVDLEKLAASLSSPKSQVVKGAVPVNKSKPQTPKGPKVDGKPTELSSNPEELENKKKQDTGLVKTGKNWFDQ